MFTGVVVQDGDTQSGIATVVRFSKRPQRHNKVETIATATVGGGHRDGKAASIKALYNQPYS